MGFTRVAVGVLASGLLAAGCGTATPGSDRAGETSPANSAPGDEPAPSASDQNQRAQLVTELAPADATTVGEAVNTFGFDLLGHLTKGDQNAITSPVSVATLLAMLLAGAGGDTAAVMADVLHLPNARDVRVGELLKQLSATDEVTLSVANGLWANKGIALDHGYLSFAR
jgi:serpin B